MEDSVQELIAGCRKRHRQSQLAMYRRFAPLVYPICLRIVGHSEEAEEAMQDTFLKLFEKLDQYHDELCFEAWIRRIAVRTAIDYVRRRLPEEELIEETLPDVPDDEEEIREQEEQTLLTVASVRNALEKEPAQARVVLSLYLFEGYDMEEISQILKIQPSSVRSQYLRGKRRLIELLQKGRDVACRVSEELMPK